MFNMFTKGFGSMDMRSAAAELERDRSIVLVDVRTPSEYAEGHIPGSINIPVDKAVEITARVPERDRKIFVYCLSGARSRSACAFFQKLGYNNVTNIGGIGAWTGSVIKN